MTHDQSYPASETQIPLSPEMAILEARELHRLLVSQEKPYSAEVVADCITTIENLVSRPVAQGQPNLKQIEAAIDDHLGNIDATYEDSRRLCAQSILNLYAVPSPESK